MGTEPQKLCMPGLIVRKNLEDRKIAFEVCSLPESDEATMMMFAIIVLSDVVPEHYATYFNEVKPGMSLDHIATMAKRTLGVSNQFIVKGEKPYESNERNQH